MHFLANPVLDNCNLLGRHFPVPPKYACYSCSVMSHSGKQREEARRMGIFFLTDKDLMSLAGTVGIRIMSVLVFLLMSMTAIHPVFTVGGYQ